MTALLNIAKSLLDFGFQSDNPDAMDRFWQAHIGLVLEDRLAVHEGIKQYRYGLLEAVVKINMVSVDLPEAPATGYRKLLIARDIPDVQSLVDPDGNEIEYVPDASLGGARLGLEIAANDMSAFTHFYGEVLGLPQAGAHAYRFADTLIRLRQEDNAATSADDYGKGLRYITLQVRGLDQLHDELVKRGVTEHMPPTQWSETSYISFIRDPDNNLIELSQRIDLQ